MIDRTMNTPASRSHIVLALLSGVMLGMAYPPFRSGMLAAFAFIPYFFLMEPMERYGKGVRYSYLMLIVFNAITLYWIGGFTHMRDLFLMAAGAAVFFFHPLFFMLPVLAFILFKRYHGHRAAVLAFPVFWTAFEYLHSVTEYSFPWLALGNTHTYDLPYIQMASITGVQGISFWLLCTNVLGYLILRRFIDEKWRLVSPRTLLFFLLLAFFYLLPKAVGMFMLPSSADDARRRETVKVGIIQPNIDPFEKWESAPSSQLAIHQKMTGELNGQNIDLVIWSENAVPFYLLADNSRALLDDLKQQVDTMRVNLLTGVPDVVYYTSDEEAPPSSKKHSSGFRYDTYNSSALLQPDSNRIQKYAKMRLVPYAERVPYSDVLSFLNAMQWNFGLGGWGIGKDTTVFGFNARDGRRVTLASMICYESIYPGFVAMFVRRGAQFITVVTNDSWWGNTSGAYQHKQIAIMRAVENRRSVARAANGGISCIIDPYGRTLVSTGMYTTDILIHDVELRGDLTFYTEHGDWFAELCLVLSLILVTTALGKKMYVQLRKRNTDEAD